MTTRADILKDVAKYRKEHGLYSPELNKLIDAIVVQWEFAAFGMFLFGLFFGFSLARHT